MWPGEPLMSSHGDTVVNPGGFKSDALCGTLSKVHDFWNVEACGTHFAQAEPGTPEFYEEFRRFRYRTEWHIPLLVPFAEAEGKSVLEIGCGNGADGVMFAQAGAAYTGVDLTSAAIEATRNHFRVMGLAGKFETQNAEDLSFPDSSFDMVYSHGVLHHTSRPAKAVAEVHRVLKPGGKAIVMLYHQHSFNYYVRIMGYMRLRVLLRILMRLDRHSRDRRNLARPLLELRGNQDTLVWQAHYENFLRKGWSYLRPSTFVHHATDGPECPFAHVFTRSSVRHLFRDFKSVDTRCAHFPLRKYSDLIPIRLERRLASLFGWYLFVYAIK